MRTKEAEEGDKEQAKEEDLTGLRPLLRCSQQKPPALLLRPSVVRANALDDSIL